LIDEPFQLPPVVFRRLGKQLELTADLLQRAGAHPQQAHRLEGVLGPALKQLFRRRPKIASQIAQTNINYKDIRQQLDSLRKLVTQLKSGGTEQSSEPASA
jgi:hypothetical protein